ncbi:MAG: hypothetical protein A2Y38_08185 [Spirochaetes bacterium GWB1_59_5]|nr:MAG: hypothetical protein A2Y38_08185 [Spirochaetes bacterium GWB1_59_5]
MSSDLWKAGPDVVTTVKDLIANHFPKLATIEEAILVVFKEKASRAGDSVSLGKTGKASPLLAVVGERDYVFTITLGADEWQRLDGTCQRALLFHHLCACGAEENPQTGDMKFYVRQADVQFFREEVEQFGFWRTSGTTPEPNYIMELFGGEPPSAGNPTVNAPPPVAPAAAPAALAAPAKGKGKKAAPTP